MYRKQGFYNVFGDIFEICPVQCSQPVGLVCLISFSYYLSNLKLFISLLIFWSILNFWKRYLFINFSKNDANISKQARCSCSGSELHFRMTVYMLLDVANLPTKHPPKLCVRVGLLQHTFLGDILLVDWRKIKVSWLLAYKLLTTLDGLGFAREGKLKIFECLHCIILVKTVTE